MPGHKAKRGGYAAPGNGVAPAFAPGNAVGVKHGASTPRLVDPVADAILSEQLSIPGAPDYASRPWFRHSMRGWAVAEAKLLLIESYMEQMGIEQQVHAVGAQQPIMALWRQMSAHAEALRSRNGLDPVSFVKIGKALSSTGIDLAKLAMLEHEGADDLEPEAAY